MGRGKRNLSVWKGGTFIVICAAELPWDEDRNDGGLTGFDVECSERDAELDNKNIDWF